MTQQRTKGAPGLKLLISAAAAAGTISGWAFLAAQTPLVTAAPAPAPLIAAAPTTPPPAWLLQPPAIPALLPVATAAPRAESIVLAEAPAAPAGGTMPAAPAAPAAPALREVAVPAPAQPAPAVSRPAPVVVSRSSR